MGKRNKSFISSVELKTKEKKIKPSLFGETPPPTKNKLITKKKMSPHTILNESLEHEVLFKKNVYVEEPEQLSTSIKKLETNNGNKTYLKKNVLKTDRNSIDRITAQVSQDSNLFTSLPQTKAKAKRKNQKEENKKNKKIIFTNDEPIEVDNKPNEQRKNKNTELPQEDNVKNEDIDKFCDELTEEDNEHYKNWIELIEAKLSTDNNKPK